MNKTVNETVLYFYFVNPLIILIYTTFFEDSLINVSNQNNTLLRINLILKLETRALESVLKSMIDCYWLKKNAGGTKKNYYWDAK